MSLLRSADSLDCLQGARLLLPALLAIASLFLCPALSAAETPDVTMQAVLVGSGLGHQLDGNDVAAETIRIKGNRLRVDFDAGEGRRGRILRGGSGHAWLLMSTSNRALPADHLPLARMLRLDPGRPCWEPDLSCEKVEDRHVAGRQTHGWRYRHAGQQGPGGTDSGVFWVDARSGIVLSYKGKDLAGITHRMEATSLSFDELPEDDFAFPESVRTDIRNADVRASAIRGGQ